MCTDLLEDLVSGLMGWDTKVQLFLPIMTRYSPRLFAKIEHLKELAKSFSELLTSSESEELPIIINELII